MRKTILSWGFFALALSSFAPTLQAQKKEPRPVVHSSKVSWGNQQYMNIDVDSSATPPRIIATYKSDTLYNLIISQGRLTSLYINGKLIPSDSFYLYDGLVKRIVDQMRRDSVQAIRDKEQAERDEEQAIRDKKQAERDAEQAEKEAIDARMEAERDARQAQADREQAVRDKKQAELDMQQAVRDKEQAVRDRKRAEEDKALLKSLLADVVKEGLAPDEKSIVSLVLDGSVFFVNGKKQSDELQKKFEQKYIRKEGYGFYINGKVMQIGTRY
ncbi:MAG: hypothetical protein BGO55_25300 [Sphingobacteriales bacterium 50-39]|nr:hypothetical protein [Sphingobacteriales bacterium]OJW58595.1 MAG: hypothetical protein BGO55_25300 [Sphingobacteriales bacterium 50-39]